MGKNGNSERLFWGAPKSLQMVTATMKLKDLQSLPASGSFQMSQFYWSFSFSISLSNEYLGLISFRMDWLDRLAVPGTLNSLLQYHSWFTGKDCNAGKDRAGKEGDDRGWDGWKTSLTQWTWVWANSGIEWRTRKPGVLQSMGSQRVRPNWVMNNNNTQRGLKFTGLQNADCVEGVVRQL